MSDLYLVHDDWLEEVIKCVFFICGILGLEPFLRETSPVFQEESKPLGCFELWKEVYFSD